MIRIHTGGCPICGSPMFVEFKSNTEYGAIKYVFQSGAFCGEIGQVIYSCECVVKAKPETEGSCYDPEDAA